jgi:hydrogenase/urease accessory protein HupE
MDGQLPAGFGAGFLSGLGHPVIGLDHAYLAGLAVIQTAVALAAMNVARLMARRGTDSMRLRFLGAGIAGVGLAIFVQQIMPAA